MAKLNALRERERLARRDWIDCLLRVEEMIAMRADDPDRGCLPVLQDAQRDAQQAGQKCRALQERIAALEGPGGARVIQLHAVWPPARP